MFSNEFYVKTTKNEKNIFKIILSGGGGTQLMSF